MSYIIFWEEKGVFVEFQDIASGKDVIRIDDILYSNDRFEKMKYQLWDFTKSKQLFFTDEEMEIIGVLDKSASIWNKKMLVPIVTTDTEFIKSIEIYKKEIEGIGWVCELFSDVASARNWIKTKLTVQ